MHSQASDWVRENLPETYESVLEVGSLDINGGIRHLLRKEASYLGIDMQKGPGVHLVADFTEYTQEPVDLILCLNTLEHCKNWRGILASCANNLKPGGLLLMTCATTGFPRHSGRLDGKPDEWYENVTEHDLRETLALHFASFDTEVPESGPRDLRAIAYAR